MPRDIRTITEPGDLRALAHPLRLRLLGALRLEGPATASELARRFEVSSGLTSYHLRALARSGFVEDDPHGTGGRQRRWKASHDGHSWFVPSEKDDPVGFAGRIEATRALNVEVARLWGGLLEKAARNEPDLDERWRGAVSFLDRWLELTPEQLRRLGEEVTAVLDRFEAEEGASSDGAAPRVAVVFAAFPDDGRLP
ncbi:MAG TPA: helix-turn-helix domain-containing protein [Solirubrobacteraceae bacterium]|jgi:DNA-binding transcriptional ArsR family regulator